VDAHVLVALLEAVVLPYVVQILASDDDSALHLHLLDNSGQDAAADRNVARERTLLVNVHARNRLLRSLEAKAYISVVPKWFTSPLNLLVQVDSGLMLKCPLGADWVSSLAC